MLSIVKRMLTEHAIDNGPSQQRTTTDSRTQHATALPRCPTTLPNTAFIPNFIVAKIMPHSKVKRAKISKHQETIAKHLEELKTVHEETFTKARVIRHKSVTLGELRAKFTPHHKAIPASLLANVNKFQRVKADPNRPLFIYGKDGGLIGHRTTLDDPEILDQLTDSLKALPRRTNLKFRGIDRGTYSTRHLTVWCAYAKKPFISRELREDEEANVDFLNANLKLWNKLSDILGQISPSTYKQFLRYPLPKGLKRFCTAWAGCVVNLGDKDPVQTKPHRDVKESIFGFSCVVPAGNYTGGALILYDLEMVIELNPGDVFMFPDSLIHHANEDITGERSSIVAFTQENLFDYWKRKYLFSNNKDKRKCKSGSKKVLERAKRRRLGKPAV